MPGKNRKIRRKKNDTHRKLNDAHRGEKDKKTRKIKVTIQHCTSKTMIVCI